jgi:hypothetical protein
MFAPSSSSGGRGRSSHNQSNREVISTYATPPRYSGRRSRPDRPASMQRTSAGSSQTQWCTQVTGLIRQLSTPVRARPPRASARRTRQAQRASTARTQAIQAYEATSSIGSRAR